MPGPTRSLLPEIPASRVNYKILLGYPFSLNIKLCTINSTCSRSIRLAPVSNVIFSITDNLSKIAIYKLYLEVEILGLDINLTIREDRIFRR